MPETHSPRVLLRRVAGLGVRRPSVPMTQPCPLSHLGQSAPGPVAPTAPNELLSAAFCKGKLSSGSKPQPQCASDRESNASRFRPGPPLSIERTGAGLPRLPGPCCFAVGLRCPKPTPHGFSFVGKQDWAREAFCAQAPAMPPEPARPLSAEAPSHRRPQTIFWQLHSAK